MVHEDRWRSTGARGASQEACSAGALLRPGVVSGTSSAWLPGCGYDTVRRFVQPLRAAEVLADRATVRFGTPPGRQSQIDWESARVPLRDQAVVVHLFVLTLSFSRRGFMEPCEDERLPRFLDSHEKTFEHFGGYTAGASLRSATYALPARRRGRGDLEPDDTELRPVLGLRASCVSPVSRADEGEGRVARKRSLPLRRHPDSRTLLPLRTIAKRQGEGPSPCEHELE
jgi:hypothetical protein